MLRSALIVEVPEAEPAVRDLRLRHSNAGLGVPAHITVLVPFLPPDRLDDRVRAELRELFAAKAPISFALTSVAEFPDETIWLTPEPAEPFLELTGLVVDRYPDYPPYEGIHDAVVPHLTVTAGNAALRDEVDTSVTPFLPIAAETTEVVLLVEGDDGTWTVGDRYPLAGNVTGRFTPRRL
jgi:2'-5' RNA ligase superfamily